MDDIKETRNYCLNCINKPCSIRGCPLGNDIPALIHEEDSYKAFKILSRTTVLPAICGRICPHFKQCQGACVRGIKGEPVKIGEAEAFIGDISLKEDYEIPKIEKEEIKQPRIAVIGSGPCGLTCSAFLVRQGASVTIFEKYKKLGGLLRHGIPDFRLDRTIVEQTVDKILNLGIKVETEKELGKNIFLKDLKKQFDYVFVSIGANKSIVTLNGDGIIKGNEFLEKFNVAKEEYEDTVLDTIFQKEKNKNIKNSNVIDNDFVKQNALMYEKYKNKDIAVSGGGNVAMDCARTFKRLGANVTVIYRRDEEQMPAEKSEIEMSKKEGVKFLVKTNIIEFDFENKKLKCIKTKLVRREGEDRMSPVNIEGSEFETHFDYVVLAIGSKTEKDILLSEGLELNNWGNIKIDDNYRTSINRVYAGGDVAGNKATVAFSARAGREAAYCILQDWKCI